MDSTKLIETVIACANDVYLELGSGWSEPIYQKAMEVALRDRDIEYDNLRTVTISYKGHIIGDAQIDLLPSTRICDYDDTTALLVVELKAVAKLEEGFKTQANKYVKELASQAKPNEQIVGALLINFSNEGKNKKLSDEVIDTNGLQILKCIV